MTDGIQIRKLNPGDRQQLEILLGTREELDQQGAGIRAQLMEWIAFNNPYREENEVTYFVAEENNRIVAFHGRMPTMFNLAGKKNKGYYIHDLYVAPDYRKKGLGFWLTIALAKAIEQESDNFFCLYGMTPLNLSMQRRRKYLEIEAPRYLKPIRPRKQLKSILKVELAANVAANLISLGMMTYEYFQKYLSNSITVATINRFDLKYDEFYNSISHQTGISTYKSSALLNWKFVDRPFNRESILMATQDGKSVGYMVVSLSPYDKANPKGIVVDLIVDPNNKKVIQALILAGIELLRKKGAETIICVMSDQRIAEVLKQLFFFRMKKGKTVMLGNLEHNKNQELITDIGNWQMMESESDSFMLSV
jgi:predicted N-acetyltransferase YhbS